MLTYNSLIGLRSIVSTPCRRSNDRRQGVLTSITVLERTNVWATLGVQLWPVKYNSRYKIVAMANHYGEDSILKSSTSR